MKHHSANDHLESSEGLSKHRLEALSDGIFAFAMTLLMLDLKIPKIPEAIMTQGLLAHTLYALWPKFLVFMTSFLQLGVYWIAHHGYSHFIKRTDRYFLWINLLFLMFIVFLPFSTNLLGDYPSHRLAVMIYGCNTIGIGLMLYWQWAYATHKHRLVGHDLEKETIRAGKMRIGRGIISYTCGVLLALFAPNISLMIYVLVAVSYLFTSRIDDHWSHHHG